MSKQQPDDLCEYELNVLRVCAGQIACMRWGAAMGQALEVLTSRGLIAATPEGPAEGGTLVFKATAKGLARLERA